MVKKITLMIDYGCDLLWWEKAEIAGDIAPESLAFSKDMIDRY